MSVDSSIADIASIHQDVEGQVKWYDPKRGYGFCKRTDANASEMDLFFGKVEAEAAVHRGLSLARGEALLCDVTYGGPSVQATATEGPQARKRSATCRPEARRLRPRPHPCADSQVGGDSCSSTAQSGASEASRALENLADVVRNRVAPVLVSVSSWAEGAEELDRLMEQAWANHAVAGRTCLEAFFQGVCFKIIEAFGRSTLVVSEGACTDFKQAVHWLGRWASAPWCWSSQQRRALAELQALASQLHGAPDVPATSCGPHEAANEMHTSSKTEDVDDCSGMDSCRNSSTSKIDDVIGQRTAHFAIILEGVRNSANQQMIFRTCEAMGVQEVWLVPPPAGQKYRVATSLRSRNASRGADRLLSIRRMRSAEEVAAACKADMRELWVTHCPSAGTASAHEEDDPPACQLADGHLPKPLPRLALVLGSEGYGVSPAMLQLASRAVYLPMYGFMQSLNVAVACGMLLQRLFDLHPEARGDLPTSARAALRTQFLAACPRLEAGEVVSDNDEERST